MSLSKLDLFYRRLILTKYYTRGWGKPEELKEILKVHATISDRATCSKFIESLGDPEVVFGRPAQRNGCTTVDGHVKSPACNLLPKLIPEECGTAHFQLVLPPRSVRKVKKQSTSLQHIVKDLALNPMCIHMAGTGDHGFSRRRELVAKPLLSHGISSLLLENPYYGIRRPKEQTGSGLLHVKDLFIMGLCLVLEAQILIRWLDKNGYGPLGLTGISMGGHMASLAATNCPEPVAIIPCMSWTSASVVWTEGVLSKAIPWRVLESQYATDPEYETKINEFIKHNTVDSYELGKDYVKHEGAIKLSSANAAARNIGLKAVGGGLKHKDVRERRRQQTLLFMKGVMDQTTDMRNFSVPVDPTLTTFVVAKADAYYPIHSLKPMDEVWPGCEVRILNTGHIAGFLMHHGDFCTAITDTFERLIRKYYLPEKGGADTETGRETTVATSTNPAASEDGSESSLIETTKDANRPSFFRTLKVIAIKS